MSIKPEERPKLIALTVALLGVVVYVLVVLVPKITSATAPATHVDPAAAVTAASAATANGGATANSEAGAALPDEDNTTAPPLPGRDTFTPPSAASHPPPQAPRAPVPLKPAVLTAPPGGFGQSGALAGGVGPAVPVPVPPVELKGVILGDPAIAVISVNGEVLQIQVGETIVAGLKLAAITDAGISIQDGKKRISVTLGHMMTLPREVPAMGNTGQNP